MASIDKSEKVIRFGCGFVFGLVFFGACSVWFLVHEPVTHAAAVLIGATIFGLAALRFGEAFWRAFGRWFSWFS